jgi:aldehyde dehydrogenase (NAD+)
MDSHLIERQLDTLRNTFKGGALNAYAERRRHLNQMQRFLTEHEESLLAALHADMGKPPLEAYVSEVAFLKEELRFILKHLKKWMSPAKVSTPFFLWPGASSVIPQPLGVCLIISPWNYPLQLALAPLAGCIAAGNSAVVLLSDQAPATATYLTKYLVAFLPKEVVWLVTGDGAVWFEALTKATRFDHIFFTGSTTVGKLVAKRAAETLTPVTLELGGKSPCIVLPDADVSITAKRIAWGKCFNAGQTCVSPDYLLVHRSLKEPLVKAVADALRHFYPEKVNAMEGGDYGHMVHIRRWRTVVDYLATVEVVHGGSYDEKTLRIEPTIVAPPSWEVPIMQEEIFGPVLPLFTFETDEELHAMLDKHPNPLAFYVFGQKGAKQLLHQRSFGGGIHNHVLMHLANPQLPFGGTGMSGMGRYHGAYSFQCFSHFKAIMRYPTWFELPILYPPYKNNLRWVRRLIG